MTRGEAQQLDATDPLAFARERFEASEGLIYLDGNSLGALPSATPGRVDELIRGQWHTKMRPEALIFAGRHLLKNWTVMDRLGDIAVPTLVMAGRDDFLFPPEHQVALAAGIANAQLRIIERAGHNAHEERPAEVMAAVRDFVATGSLLAR